MPSQSLQGFLQALSEVGDLGSASHPEFGPKAPELLRVARAIGRAQIVLLTSHFERYIHAINEETIAFLNTERVHGDRLPELFRLLHSKISIDNIGEMSWESRAVRLSSFIVDEGWLWRVSESGVILHDRILAWMKSPKPESLTRYFRYWGIQDIFTAISRSQSVR